VKSGSAKGGKDSSINFRMYTETNQRIVNKLRNVGSLLKKKKRTETFECSMKIN
jgi:hypothetical protein